jgi:hypothetical protein
VQPAVVPDPCFLEITEVTVVVVLGVEAGRAVISALDDVQRLPRYHDSWKTGHDVFLFVEVPGVTLA